MKRTNLQNLISREKRAYLFAASCSAIAALLLFYKLFLNDLYLKILDYPWIAAVLSLLILGNIVHGFFAFKSYQTLDIDDEFLEVINVKVSFYKSMIINFITPYIFLIILFIVMKEFFVASVALVLLVIMSLGCYFLDYRPTMNILTKETNK